MQDYKIGMGERIKKKRRELHLTQEKVAEQLGISVKHFSETERGISGLSVENLIKLSDLLHMSLDEMIKGTRPDMQTSWNILLEPISSLPTDKQNDLISLITTAIQLVK